MNSFTKHSVVDSINRCLLIILITSSSLFFNPPVHADSRHKIDWLNPPGRLINVGTHRLHLKCKGWREPIVILDSGMGAFSLDWVKVQEAVQDQAMVCAYDRAGYGWSDPGPGPRTTTRIVDELHTLLLEAGLTPPFIMVGHSFGGYNVQYFAKLYPELTSGLILVDSSHPDQSNRLPELPAKREKQRLSNIVPVYTNLSSFLLYPQEIRTTLLNLISLRKYADTQVREFRSFITSARQVSHSGRLPAVPLTVISRGQHNWPDTPYGMSLEQEWQRMQLDLADQIPKSKQIIAANSGHLIHLEQPMAVVSAILSMVAEIRAETTDNLKNLKIARYRNIGG